MKKKIILFNCTTNIIGGGVKNAAYFIKNALNDNTINWYFSVSKNVNDLLVSWGLNHERVYLISPYPSKSRQSKLKLLKLIKTHNISAVYTMAGPAYVRFPVPHIMGISNAYITHSTLQALFFYNSPWGIIKRILLSGYQLYHATKADFWFFQTEISRNGFCKRTGVSRFKTKIIPNAIQTASCFFDEKNEGNKINEIFKIFSPSADHRHRGIQYIPKIAKALSVNFPEFPFKFYITLPETSKLWASIKREAAFLGTSKYIENLGPFNFNDIYKLYSSCSIVFIPSILETFSSNYLEAMVYKKPLVVNNKSFARDICGNAAIYVNPNSSNECAEIFFRLSQDESLRKGLIVNGIKTASVYPDQKERYSMIVNELIHLV